MASAVGQPISGCDRFRALWQRCLIAGATDDSAAVHRRLLDAYREPQRHYHNLAHIEHCLAMFDLCKPLASHPDALELAIWFHDVIYHPGQQDNEAHSAALYLEISAAVHVEQTRQLVDRLIMATIHDGRSLTDRDATYMVDIDLSSFGLPWEEFLRDSRQLRQENPGVSDADYYRNQGNFQQCLISRNRFYLSDFFAQRFESQARENLARYHRQIQSAS